jgi:hypothetical protein
MLMQFLDVAAVFCMFEHWDFKKAKERTWDSASLRAKTLRESKKTMGQYESMERDFKE